jgi:RimJ/RimL family protein N-acetyltransferase
MAASSENTGGTRVELVGVGRHNYLDAVALCVSPEEERFVGTAAEAIADLHYLPGLELWGVQAEGQLVGLVLVEECPVSRVTLIRRLLIDCHHQRRGYASAAIRTIANAASIVMVCVHQDAAGAIALYNKLGFSYVPRNCAAINVPFQLLGRTVAYPPDHHYAVFREYALVDGNPVAKSNIPLPAVTGSQ